MDKENTTQADPDTTDDSTPVDQQPPAEHEEAESTSTTAEERIKEAEARLEEARKHSRTWEARAKGNKEELDKLRADLTARESELTDTRAQLDTLTHENALVTTLAATGADVAALLDSRSFMDAAYRLDHTADTFAEQLAELVNSRTVHTVPTHAPITPVKEVPPTTGARRLSKLMGLD
ncbi:hypothetical protein [Corynebacterium aquilae]|uniref:Scaffolding protein n=1 Tax=Corynebacterium aquilae DSM 44791 TaxID=1431546 RepID=A0A1L7CF99_9CORY|nr:hypothetical protein [Corynebacterium aquilae]APT84506.1 hypothetical protein CAQU_04895 [Corynebacterium aquilae DSM 44791]